MCVSTAVLVSSCAPNSSVKVQQASQKIMDSLGCADVKSKIFDALYEAIDSDQAIPSIESLTAAIDEKLNHISLANAEDNMSEKKIKNLKKSMHQLLKSLLAESSQNPKITWKDQVQKLIEFEMEDQSTAEIKLAGWAISSQITDIKNLSQELKINCQAQLTPQAPNSGNAALPPASHEALTAPKGKIFSAKIAKGVEMVFSTAYQSCRTLDLPAMDHGTTAVVGISRVGTHPDGVGGKREITNLAAVQNTHYYLRGLASEAQCAPVKNNPLIYDYGGEPAIAGNTINFQKNAGTGTGALGVDCSSYVSSTIAVAGLRYKPGLDNKPIFIRQTSTKFIDAVQSGFSCFENITVDAKSSIATGDIVGVKGHVVIVDSLGPDPFGLQLLNSVNDCQNINYKNFDFIISQSSPSKNGIGINRFVAKDYLDESLKMRAAFQEMARQSCLAHFQNKPIKPQSTDWGFLRHKGTPECLANRVFMVGEACTQKCF